MDQSTDVAVLADENTPLFGGLGEERNVAGVRYPLRSIDHVVTGLSQRPNRRSDDVGISQNAHLLRRDDETFFCRKLAQPRGIQEAGIDVVRLKNRISLEHGLPGCALGEHGEHHSRRYAAATNNGFTAHFSRLGPDARKEAGSIHRNIIPHCAGLAHDAHDSTLPSPALCLYCRTRRADLITRRKAKVRITIRGVHRTA